MRVASFCTGCMGALGLLGRCPSCRHPAESRRTNGLRAGSAAVRTTVDIAGADPEVAQEIALAVRERCIQLGLGFDIAIGNSRHTSGARSPRGVVVIRTMLTPQDGG